MTKHKRGNFFFVTYIGDHSPYHVHVYKDGKEVVKWDLENGLAMKGRITRTIRKHLDELQREGKI
jgi:hypothetical protein